MAAPAAVAIWSGWVKLGGMCGFGPVNLLPGIANLTINTAITLPVGVEAYGAFALGVWIGPGAVPDRARRFAFWSAIGALLLGMSAQVIVHLLEAAGRVKAPWPVVVLVSCMPVVVLGFGAALTHLLRDGDGEQESPAETVPAAVPAKAPARKPLPPVRQIREEYDCGQATAVKIRKAMRTRDKDSGVREPPSGAAGTEAALAVPAASSQMNGDRNHA